ncbi:MAG: hypothetical protein GKR91_08610 [Pseudomonadales bacterium]|nr:hypothetical protein [Pseudomonadales bacterium]
MNREKLKQFALISEIVGGIAVLVTLVFLILQISENTNAIRLQTLGDARARLDEAYFFKMNNSELIAKSYSEPENLSDEELIELANLWIVFESVLLTYWDAYQSGIISEVDWNRWARSAPGMLGEPVGRSIWEASYPTYSNRNRQDFADAIDAAMRDMPNGGDNFWIEQIKETTNEYFR